MKYHLATLCITMLLVGCTTVQPKTKPLASSPVASKPHGKIYLFFHPKERFWQGTHPDLRSKVEAIQQVMADEGFDLRPTEGFRSPERQAQLLAANTGVTQVGAWSSCHNYGLALDAAIFIDGKPSWDIGIPKVLAGYERYGQLAEQLGLTWGGRWTSPKDYPHVELTKACGIAKWQRRRGLKPDVFIAKGEPTPAQVLAAHTFYWTWPMPALCPTSPTYFAT